MTGLPLYSGEFIHKDLEVPRKVVDGHGLSRCLHYLTEELDSLGLSSYGLDSFALDPYGLNSFALAR